MDADPVSQNAPPHSASGPFGVLGHNIFKRLLTAILGALRRCWCVYNKALRSLYPRMTVITVPEQQIETLYPNYSGAGPLTFDWVAVEVADVAVEVNGVDLATGAYSVAATSVVEGGIIGGTVTLNTAVTNARVVLYRKTPPRRTTNYAVNGLNPDDINKEFARHVMIDQEQARLLANMMATYPSSAETVADSLLLGKFDGSGYQAVSLGPAADRVNTFLYFGADGLPVTVANEAFPDPSILDVNNVPRYDIPQVKTLQEQETVRSNIGARAQLINFLGVNVQSAEFTYQGITYPAATAPVPFNVTDWYVGINRYSKRLVALRHDFDDGTIFLGQVTTGGSGVTSVKSYEVPQSRPCRIPRALELMRSGSAMNIATDGSSLGSVANAGDRWPQLVMGNRKGVDIGYHLRSDAQAAADSGYTDTSGTRIYNMGGSQMHNILSHIAELVEPVKDVDEIRDGQNWVLNKTQAIPSTYENPPGTFVDRAPPFVPASQILQRFDLLVIDPGINGGIYRGGMMQKMFRYIRSVSDIEILILTANALADNNDYFLDYQSYMREMCDRYNCGLADTYSYTQYYHRLFRDGLSTTWIYPIDEPGVTSSDVTHPGTLGTAFGWAQAIRGCLPNAPIPEQNSSRVNIPITKWITPPDDGTVQFPTGLDPNDQNLNFDGLQFMSVPVATTGTFTSTHGNSAMEAAPETGSVGEYREYRHTFPPNAITVGKFNPSTFQNIVVLAEGESAVFAHNYAYGGVFAISEASDCNFEVAVRKNNADFATGTGQGAAFSGFKNPNMKMYTRDTAFNTAVPIEATPTLWEYTITNTSTGGTTELYTGGVLWHVPKTTPIPFKDMEFLGTWANKPTSIITNSQLIDIPITYYSDDVRARIVIPFTGRWIEISQLASDESGQMELWIDGYLKTPSPVKIQRGSSEVSVNSTRYLAEDYGDHTAVFKFTPHTDTNTSDPEQHLVSFLGALAGY